MAASAWTTSPFRLRFTRGLELVCRARRCCRLRCFSLRAHDQDSGRDLGALENPHEMNEQAIQYDAASMQTESDRNELASIYKGEIAKAGGQVYWMHMAVAARRQFSGDQ